MPRSRSSCPAKPGRRWTQRNPGCTACRRWWRPAPGSSWCWCTAHKHRAQGQVIGTALLFRFDAGSARLELGYVLGRVWWRQGLMHEALVAVCGHAFGSAGVRRIEAEVNPANTASTTLLQRLGFTLEGRLRQRWVGKGRAYDTLFYGCLADEWPG
jgi:RimJ/RimL family protein N-acetyltransferase